MSGKAAATPGGGKTTFSGPFFRSEDEDHVRVRSGLVSLLCYGVVVGPGESRGFVRDPNAPEGWVPVKGPP
jgi:hypothetical protein